MFGRILIAGLLWAAACAQPTLVPTPESTPALVEPDNPAAHLYPTPTSVPLPVSAATATPEPERSPVRLEITEGSEARYLVKEQFARRNVPNDAIGKTREVTGAILFDGDGAVVPEESILLVDLSALRSDDDDRDEYLRGESLESEEFPFAEFVVIDAPGLPWPLPPEGQGNFQLQGEMTLHGNTSPLLWEVTAQFAPDQIVGTARTNFDFARFHLVRPSRFFLLSVEDNIRLDLDFRVSVTQSGE
ncbi:MAG TPA: YceI family protein [Dehalococcoidia bacterium]|nr:YceI family protein [Dehalococcoidia bacterium]